MKETRRLKFAVLQYAPSVLSNRFVNIAVLCYEVDTGTFGDAEFLGGWEPALQLDPDADVEMLDALKNEIQSGWLDVEKRGMLLRVLLDAFSNSVQISQEYTCITNDPEHEMRNMVLRFL